MKLVINILASDLKEAETRSKKERVKPSGECPEGFLLKRRGLQWKRGKR